MEPVLRSLLALALFLILLPPSAAHAAVPQLTLTTRDAVPIESKDDYVAGWLTVADDAIRGAPDFSGEIKIRGRGNSTWRLPKKPYKIKLDRSARLLGMPADKEWVLLANYSDKTLMRNMLAFEMGRRLGMAYVPRSRVVEVSLNGKELGTYLLTEQIKTSKKRIDILTDDIRGGYVLELDGRREDQFKFETSRGQPFAIKEPPAPTALQLSYISGYVQESEDVLNAEHFKDPERGYRAFFDVNSFIDFYLVQEILKNQDGANFSSIYSHKAADGKLTMGPLWDFDIGAGNVNYSVAQEPEGWWVRSESPWYKRLFEDPAFESAVKVRWRNLNTVQMDLNSVLAQIDRYAEDLEETQRKNFMVWDILGIWVWPNRVVTGSYAGEVEALKQWLTLRWLWLDRQYGG